MEEENKKKSFKEKYGEYISYAVVIIVLLLFKKYIVSPIRVNGASMMKTLHNGDVMILNIIGYRLNNAKRFDIVVVKEGGSLIIKRVIGLPGEEVEYKDNKLYINNKLVKDPYGNGKTTDFKVKLDDDYYFVLGDNRSNSLDSRAFGAFSKDDIVGKTDLIIFPFNRFGKKE